jgi:uncharacterized protein (TIGR02246 family)
LVFTSTHRAAIFKSHAKEVRIMRLGVPVLAFVAVISLTGHATAQRPSWPEVWLKGDAKALAEFYAPDADFIRVDGESWKGREEIERGFQREFELIRQQYSKDVVDNLTFRIMAVAAQRITESVRIYSGTWRIEGLPQDTDLTTEGRWTNVTLRNGAEIAVKCSRDTVPSFLGQQPMPEALPSQAGISDPKAEEAARATLAAYVQAYNDHNADALFATFVPDGVFAPSGTGMWRIGEFIRSWHKEFPFTRWGDAKITKMKVHSARFVTPDVLVADSGIERKAAINEEETIARVMVFTVHVRKNDVWKIQHMTWAVPYQSQRR